MKHVVNVAVHLYPVDQLKLCKGNVITLRLHVTRYDIRILGVVRAIPVDNLDIFILAESNSSSLRLCTWMRLVCSSKSAATRVC